MIDETMPCRQDCPDRSAHCHAECEKYLAYAAERRKVYEARYKETLIKSDKSRIRRKAWREKMNRARRGKR